MTTFTIPKRITKGESLVIVPKKEWEALKKIAKQLELENGLKEALEDVKAGRVIGPFDNADDLIKNLEK